MTVTEIIQLLAEKDIRLWLEDGQLGFSAPDGAMTPDVIELIKSNKPALIEFFTEAQQQDLPALDIPRIDRTGLLPLSSAQQRLWFIHQLEPDSDAYHIHAAVRLTGQLNIEKLQQCVDVICQRHEVLRSHFVLEQGLPFVALSDETLRIESRDLANGSTDKSIEAMLQAHLSEPFDLLTGPLSRVALFKESSECYVLSLCMHHIISDGWSLGVLLKELIQLYLQSLQNIDLNTVLDDLPCQYADYAAWQSSDAFADQKQAEVEYWQGLLNDIPILELPFDQPASAEQGSGRVTVEISDALSQQVDACAKQASSTLFAIMISAYAALLSKLTGQKQFAIGTPVAGRMHASLDDLIGCFVNTQALTFDVGQAESFAALLAETHRQNIEGMQHQALPFEEVLQHIEIERNIDISPVFQTLFVLQNAPIEQTQLPGFSVEPMQAASQAAQFDLALHVRENGSSIVCDFIFKSEKFSQSFIERIASFYESLLSQVLADAAIALDVIDLLSEQDRKLWLDQTDGFNATQNHFEEAAQGQCVYQLIHAQALKSPELLAVQDANGSLSYQALDQQSSQLANTFIDRGFSGGVIALHFHRSCALNIVLLACQKAGCAYLPIDTGLPGERIAYILEHSEAKALVTDALWDKDLDIPEACAHLAWFELEIILADFSDALPQVPAHPLFNIIYTSGSTGLPKGVEVKQSGILNRMLWMREKYPMNAEVKVLQKTPYSFDVAEWELFLPLMCGASIYHADPGMHVDPVYIRDIASAQGITHIHFVPSMLEQFLLIDGVESLTAITQVYASGEALQVSHVRGFQERLPQAKLINLYGPTEASIEVSYFECPENIDQAGLHSIPIGKPIDNTQLYVLDENQKLLPVGVPGELYIAGNNVAQGYCKAPELTEKSFVDNPVAELAHLSPKVYRTGDKVRLVNTSNGYEIEYIGRFDHQVKLRGLRVELGEIEYQLNVLDGVDGALVTVLDDVLVAYIVCETDLAADELKRSLADKLPAYMVPQHFVCLRQWPHTSSGKIDRKALPKVSFERQLEFVAPRNTVEEKLVEIWLQVLSVDEVSVNDNFFDLGGHSLLATQAYALAQDAFDVDIPLREIFDSPTIAGIAQVIERKQLERSVFMQGDEGDEESDDEVFVL